MQYKRVRTDVLIIGGGVAGFTAAYHIPEEKTVTLLNTGRGASPFITGFDVPVEPGDSPEMMFEDEVAIGCGQNDTALVRTLCENSVDTIAFLESIGFVFDRKDGKLMSRRPVGASFARVIGNGNDSGKKIVDLLAPIMKARSNYSQYNTVRALKLMVKDGHCLGALAVDKLSGDIICFDASAVILACGGFCRLFGFSSNTPDIGGDGAAMALDAGLDLVDMEFINYEPSAAVWPPQIIGMGMITTLNHEGAVMYNNKKERFMYRYSEKGEQAAKDVMGRAIYTEVKEGRGSEHGGIYMDCSAVPAERIHEAYEMFYQRYIRWGIDLTKEPIEIFPAAHTSLGGVRIASDCSTAVKGLYAAGEVAGGVHGANRMGGMAGTETLVFGRICGLSVAESLAGAEAETASDEDWNALIADCAGPADAAPVSDGASDDIRNDIAKILTDDFNVIREGSSMERSLEKIRNYLMQAASCGASKGGLGILKRMRLLNDISTACAFASAALERTDSCGCHYRSDSIQSDTKYRTCVRKGMDGIPCAVRETF